MSPWGNQKTNRMKTEINITKYALVLEPNELPIIHLGSNGSKEYWGIHQSRAVFGNGYIRDERDDCLDYIGDNELTGWELVEAIDEVRSIKPKRDLIKVIEAFTNCYIKTQYNQYALCRRDYDADGVEQVRYEPEYGDYLPFSDILLAFLIGGRKLEHIQC